MSIQNEISRIEQAKSDIKSAIEVKGVEVPESVKIDGYPELVRQIGKNYKYRFGVISDIHIGKYDGENDFIRAIRFFESQEVDFVVITGDLTNNGTEEEIIEYKRIKDELNVSFPIYACRGNHDRTIGWEAWEANVGNHPYYTFEKDGDTFILLSIDDGYSYEVASAYLYGNVRVNEFDPFNKRVFLFMHYPIYGFAGLKESEEYGFSSYDQWQYDIYNRFGCYCMIFNGHTHYDFEITDEYQYNRINVYTDDMKTTIHVPSCAYTRYPDHTAIPDNSQGYIVDVYQNGTNLRGVDFKLGKYLPEYEYFMRNDKLTEQKKRYIDLQWEVGSMNLDGTVDDDDTSDVRTPQFIPIDIGCQYYLELFDTDETRIYFYNSDGSLNRVTDYLEGSVPKIRTCQKYCFNNTDGTIKIKTLADNQTERHIALYRVSESVPVSKITLDKTRGTLKVGEQVTLTATVHPEENASKTVTWKSTDLSVATVDNGVVTAVSGGMTIIRALIEGYKGYNYEAQYLLTVEGKTIVNGLEEAVDIDGTPYNEGIGYKKGYRLSNSGGESECELGVVTGYMPYKYGQRIFIEDFKCPCENTGKNHYTRIAMYNTNKELIGVDAMTELRWKYCLKDWWRLKDSFTGMFYREIEVERFTDGTIPTDAAYVRISAIGIGENPAIYIV